MSDSLSRRTFLVSGAAAATALATTDLPTATASGPARSAPPTVVPKKRKILVLGGTGFLGPAIVRAGLAKGHEFSLFHRGKTNPGLFPEVEHLTGQRRRPNPANPKAPPQDLKALENGRWDAVVDTSGYYTGEVEDACKALAGRVEQYVYIQFAERLPHARTGCGPGRRAEPALRVRRQMRSTWARTTSATAP